MLLETFAAIIAGRGRMKRPASQTVAARDCTTSPMSNLDTRPNEGTDPDRDEPTVIDRRPPLNRLPVYTGEGTISSWVLAEGWSEDAWISAIDTIPEGEWQ